MDELDRVLAVLRDEPSGMRPASGLGDIDDLVGRTRAAGLPITLERRGDLAAVPPAIGREGYRVLQEALTNVLRHANATRATVELLYRPRSIEIAVLDDGRGSSATTGDPTGHGLAGMHERADLFEGTFQAGPMREGGFAVRASLPTDPRPA
jgi:signal transduction histidine kinase